MTEEEYVGHLIDKHGISFTKEKKDKVFEFRLPEKHHEMKSFLGLCSQYRDHIPNYAQMSAQLHEMIKGTRKIADRSCYGPTNLKRFTTNSRTQWRIVESCFS